MLKFTKKLFTCCLILCVAFVAHAKDQKYLDSYNFTRAIEAFQNENYDEVMTYLNEEIKDNPNNGYAHAWVAYLNANLEQYGPALTHSNIALKKHPSKDKEHRAWTYRNRSMVYAYLEDTVAALNDLTQAISLQPENTSGYETRGQIYYELGQHDLSIKDYERIIALDEGSVMGYMGIGRSLYSLKQYDEAIALYDYVIKITTKEPIK